MSLKEKIFSTRIAIEKILFEKEVISERKLQKKYYYYLFFVFFVYFFVNLLYFYFNSNIISYKISNFNFSKLTLSEILFHSDYFTSSFEMPFYALVLKLVSLVFKLNSWTIFIINIFASMFGLLGYYLLIAKTRNEQAGLIGVIALISTPFFINLTRQLSSNIFSFVFLVWSYYYYVRIKTQVQHNSIPYFVIFYSLGLLSDKFFILYTLPSFSFISFLFNTVYSSYILLIFIPSFIISIIFYIRFLILFLIKYSFSTDFVLRYFNFKEIFHLYFNYFGLIPFFIIFPFFIWMIFSVYNPYICKKEIFKWFFYPLLIFFIVSISPEVIGFTIPAIVIGFSVMSFSAIRKKLGYFFMILFILSFIKASPLDIRGYKLWGVIDGFDEHKIVRHIMYAISNEDNLKKGEVYVAVKFHKKNINSHSFEALKEKYMLKNLKFRDFAEEFLPFSCYLITDKKTDGLESFNEVFFYKGVYLLKNPFCFYKFSGESYFIPKIKISNMEISDINFKVINNFSTDGVKDLYVDIGYLGYNGIDFYGIKGIFKDAIVNSDNKYFISNFSTFEIKSVIINQYSIESVLESKKKTDIEVVFMKNIIKFLKNFGFFDFVISLSPEIKDNTIYFRALNIKIGDIKLGAFFSDFFVFKLSFEKLNFPLKFSKIYIGNELIKLSS
ncbi:MAG: glycosyltransferase family 39 protein [Elusimicrobiales bacterium]|nr:glycosyltransferase family 39 protein [Elusimicrobiales bacterium]